jgi:serine/threonine protein kinase
MKLAAFAASPLKDPKTLQPESSPSLEQIISPNKIGPYHLRQPIGEGAFSVVRIAVKEHTQKTFACKIVPKKRLIEKGLADQFDREAQILTCLRHPFVCALQEILFDTINCYAVMEYCPFGSLSARILKSGKLKEHESQMIFKQIIIAIAYVHSQGIAHRDIKPENILLDDASRVKVIDFGLSNYQTDHLLSTPVGSTCFAAPECFTPHGYDGFKCDAWSCAVVLFVMLTGQFPWTSHNTQQMVDQITSAQYHLPPSFPEEAADLVRRVLVVDANARLSIDGILNHPWLAGVNVPLPSSNTEQAGTIRASRSLSFAPDASRSPIAACGRMLIQKGRMARLHKMDSSDLPVLQTLDPIDES